MSSIFKCYTKKSSIQIVVLIICPILIMRFSNLKNNKFKLTLILLKSWLICLFVQIMVYKIGRCAFLVSTCQLRTKPIAKSLKAISISITNINQFCQD
ncbi:hypothetical protein BpHYR1_003113 [Brachionus plicatilis]|uniref:Uncharacterized protein n=1 Tax=Brachionus plicatilis TaxID=10195 RepID=A0A3M7PPC8_BRAPC|nr:hypothetical protein BpHYR1_003113 [Brachionus plicatilis]